MKRKKQFEPTQWEKILRELREEAGHSRRELADKCNMPHRTISEYENMTSSRELSIYKIERILDTLGYEIDFFLKQEKKDV
jgi:transcriptional regulator with XRE-family HTH domain